MTRFHTLALLVAGLFMTFSHSTQAQAPLKDPQARVQAAMQSAAALKSVAFSESFQGKVVTNGSTSESALQGEVVLNGKEGLSSTFTMQRQKIRLVSDGTTHCLYIIGDKTYQKTDEVIPRTQLMCVVARGIFGTSATWVAGFLHNKTELLDTSGAIEAKDTQNIDGAECEGYLLPYSGFDVTVWLTKSDPPTLRRADVDLKKTVQNQGANGGPSDATVQVDITDWKPNVATTDSQFVFTPPDGVEMTKPGSDTLEGKKADDFELALLGGGSVKLSALKGKPVVLDFWATWCGPCRKAMPIVEKVTEEFADKGLLLYAVNLQEDAEKVQGYLQSVNLNPKVALDKEGTVARAYGAPPIPSIILIGADGVIKKVFRGISQQFEDDLRNALTGLVKDGATAK